MNFRKLYEKECAVQKGNNVNISAYENKETGLKLVHVPFSGPLVSSTIIVPTLSRDNSGLPHTLEHLVFCGV
jgi:Zn-dependent M16 (insulinase) family peptidase